MQSQNKEMNNNFIKHNYKDNDTFVKEANDLKRLAKYTDTSYIKIPEVFNASNETLEIERIYLEKSTPELMKKFGIGLAKLHQHKFPQYGFEEDNFIGLNLQKNELNDNWGAFFYKNRIQFQVGMVQPLSLRHSFEEILERKQKKIIDFLNEHCAHASLVHGDLWSGNVLFDKKSVWLIDPSSYYADREVDIAMTELFSGFTDDFYTAYNETYALSSEYDKKKIIYNLYHLLNHYNLFGHTYLEECNAAFEFIEQL